MNTKLFFDDREEIGMPRGIDKDTRREIVYLRALDYDKQEIAEKVGVSRNTVRKHLNEVREDVEGSDAAKTRLATIILDEQQIPAYAVEQSAATLDDLTKLLGALGNDGDTDDSE